MLTKEDAVHLDIIVQEETDRAYRAVCARVHAMVEDGKVEESYKRAVADALPKNTALEAENAALKAESAELLIDLDIARAEVERLRTCVIEQKRRADLFLSKIDEVRTLLRVEPDCSLIDSVQALVAERDDLRARSLLAHHGPYHDVDTADLAGGDAA